MRVYPFGRGIVDSQVSKILESLTFDDLDRWGEMLVVSIPNLMLAGTIAQDSLSHHHVEMGDEVIKCIAAVTD